MIFSGERKTDTQTHTQHTQEPQKCKFKKAASKQLVSERENCSIEKAAAIFFVLNNGGGIQCVVVVAPAGMCVCEYAYECEIYLL